MRTLIFFGIFSLTGLFAAAQVQTQIVGDSVHIHGNTGTGELRLENSTDTVPGFLFNTGGGRTQFVHGLIKVNDSTYVIGADTLRITNTGGAPTLSSVLTAGNHAIAGTTTAPPIIMRPGPVTTTPIPGAVEYDGVGYYITDSLGVRHDLTQTNRTFEIYSLDYTQTDSAHTYTLINWNVDYNSNTTNAHTLASTLDFQITVPQGTNPGTVISIQLQGVTIYTLTVTDTMANDSYVIGVSAVNQDIKYPNLFYVRGATETINGAGVVGTQNTAYRLYPESFSNPTLTFTVSGMDDGSIVRIGCTYFVDKKQMGDWLFE